MKHFIAVVLFAAFAVLVLPQNADAQRPSLATIDQKLDDLLAKVQTVSFAGFSTITVNGAGDDGVNGPRGIIGMHAACQGAFGAEARMCTTLEFALSPSATAPSADAWVHPTYLAGAGNQDRLGINSVAACKLGGDFSFWSSDASNTDGPVVRTDNFVAEGANCLISRPVTCCIVS